MNDINSDVGASESYAETDGMPVGETDTYLVSMVASVESDAALKKARLVKIDADPGLQASRRASLLRGEE